MATIRSYTTIEQSKVLSEILPLESADMFYSALENDSFPQPIRVHLTNEHWKQLYPNVMLPTWSLASLLSVLPNEIITDNRIECHYQIHIRKYDGGDNTTLHQIAYGNNRGSSGSWHDMINTGEKESLIDCCVDMIINLHELNLW